MYIPSIKTAIEYDGEYYHNNEEIYCRDNEKDKRCKALGIKLYRFRDPKLKNTNNAIIITCRDGYNRDLTDGIKKLFDYLNLDYSLIEFLIYFYFICIHQKRKEMIGLIGLYFLSTLMYDEIKF